MIYTNVSGRHRSAIKIQVTALDPGIIVEADEPMRVTIASLRPDNHSSCTLRVSSYFALAASVTTMLKAVTANPAQPAFCDRITWIRRQRPQDGGYIELSSETSRGVLLVDSEFLSIGDKPHYVITTAQQTTGIRLTM